MVEPKLLIVLLTYNRKEYTKKTLRSLWDTIQTPYYLVAVDNNSDDGTQDYLLGLKERNRVDKVILNPENYYPGKATNIGWAEGLKEYPNATHLMRLDNDMHLESGWDVTALEYFARIPSMGQVGLDHEAIETDKAKGYEVTLGGKTYNSFPGCVGGPNIIRRLVWDKGIRYDESKWEAMAPDTPTIQEDFRLSKTIKDFGFLVGHMTEPLGRTFANKTNWSDYPDYYRKTMTERGYGHILKEVFGNEYNQKELK